MQKQRELAVGAMMLIAGAAYLWAALYLPGRPGVDAATVPIFLGGLICVLGVFQLRAALALKAEAGGRGEGGAGPVEYGTTLKTMALILVYTALLNKVGFLIMTALYLFVQFVVLTPADRRHSFVPYAVIAVVTSVSVYALFRYGFDLVLPVGLIDFD